MLHKKTQDAFNRQINAELQSSYLYLSMSAYFQSKNLPGMARWMAVQSREEVGHAMKFYEHINQRGGRVILTQLDAPKTEWASPLEAFQDTYKHERKITALIYDLVELAASEKDHAASVFLQWFVTEQVEEETSALEILENLKLVGDQDVALLMLDRHLGQRAA